MIPLLIGVADERSQLAKRDLKEADGAQAVGTAVIVSLSVLICAIVVGDAGTMIASLRLAFGVNS
jgi:hypothetical protein